MLLQCLFFRYIGETAAMTTCGQYVFQARTLRAIRILCQHSGNGHVLAHARNERKECIHILRDPRTMLIVLLMPVVLMMLFGFAISTEIKNRCLRI